MEFANRFGLFQHAQFLARPNNAQQSPVQFCRQRRSRRDSFSLAELLRRSERKLFPPVKLPRRAQTTPPSLARVSIASCSSPPSRHAARPAPILGQHLQIIQLLRDFRFGHAIHNLPPAPPPPTPHFLPPTHHH